MKSKEKKKKKLKKQEVDKKRDEVCPRCGSRKLVVDEERGEIVCSKCGLVVSKGLFLEGKDWRAFSTEEFVERARAGAPVSPAKTAYGFETKIAYSRGLSAKNDRRA